MSADTCTTDDRLGHDDTCRYGCNDTEPNRSAEYERYKEQVIAQREVARVHCLYGRGEYWQPYQDALDWVLGLLHNDGYGA